MTDTAKEITPNHLLAMKKKMVKSSLPDAHDNEIAFWQKKQPYERFVALELLRQRFYRYDSATTRFQRILQLLKKHRFRGG